MNSDDGALCEQRNNETIVGGTMKTFTRILVLLPISICVSLFVQVQAASSSQLQRDSLNDTLKSRPSPTNPSGKDKTFKLLPRYDHEKDTAGFKLIPKHSEDADFIPYDKEPQIVRQVEPKYPESAMRAGLEGRVVVKMWVDTDGKVKEVVVLKSDAEIFNKPAIEAAKQFLFTPAYLHNKPVGVWVSYPFLFRLRDKR